MLGKNSFRKLTTLFTLAAVWCVYSTVAFAAPINMAGEITVSGQVTVNGQSAVSNATILSGSSIVTGADSTAIVSLGKTGRIEVLANSSLTLNFSDNSIIGILNDGKARIANSAGVATTVTTKNATVIADAGQANNYTHGLTRCEVQQVQGLDSSILFRLHRPADRGVVHFEETRYRLHGVVVSGARLEQPHQAISALKKYPRACRRVPCKVT